MRVAVLGTGTMGAGMARTLRREGHDVTAWNRTRSKAEPLSGNGIEVAESVTEAVTDAEAAITILFDAEAVVSVTDELTGALGDGVWLQSATVGPDGIARIAERAGAANLLDAPVVGTKKPAEEGLLVPLVSGPRRLVERVQPVFDAIGSKTVYVGDRVGLASGLKLACNAWIASLTAATAQSLALAAALGVDPQLFLDTISGGPTDTPYAQLKGTAMLKGDYAPSFAVDGLAKDVQLMLDSAGPMQADLLQTLLTLYGRASDRGHGGDDIAAVRTAFD
jgi:3-hydroxyisobutyrate dehydrogenase